MKLSPKGCRGRKRKIEKIEREKRWDKEEGSKRGREKEGPASTTCWVDV